MSSELWKAPSPLLLYLKHQAMNAHSERMLAKIAMETGSEAPSSSQAKLPGDARALRGIPAIGHGVGGTMSGTQPEQETIRREDRRLKLNERTADR